MRRPAFIRYAVLVISFFTLLMSWEYQLAHASLFSTPIPEESIRLRILANSDSPADQWIKRKVRDEVMGYMEGVLAQTGDPEVVRAEIANRLEDFGQVVGRVLRENGFDYEYALEYGPIEFPVKPYGRRLYPAGEYEALRITIGEGKGQNWWCVLFPPLCFVDLVKAKESDGADEGADKAASASAHADHGVESAGTADPEQTGETVEMRFFIAELFAELVQWVKSLWA